MRRFLGIHLTDEQVPDSTTLLRFRKLLEEHKLGKRIFKYVTNCLNKQGLIMHGDTIVDETILEASSFV